MELHGVRHGRFGRHTAAVGAGARVDAPQRPDLHANRSHDGFDSSVERPREHWARPRGRSIRRSDRLQRGLRSVVAPRVTKPSVRRRRAAHQRSPAFEQSEEASRRSAPRARLLAPQACGTARRRRAPAARRGAQPQRARARRRSSCPRRAVAFRHDGLQQPAARLEVSALVVSSREGARESVPRSASPRGRCGTAEPSALTDNAFRRACAPAHAGAARA